jgi:hypothetical protein
MKPGETTRPVASIVRRPLRESPVIATILPLVMPTFNTESSLRSGSITLPRVMTMSYGVSTAFVALRAGAIPAA